MAAGKCFKNLREASKINENFKPDLPKCQDRNARCQDSALLSEVCNDSAPFSAEVFKVDARVCRTAAR
jgi:hypothetical protein